MVVYADILVSLNTVVTYFILLAAKSVCHAQSGFIRMTAASVVGGFSSLYIFLPEQGMLSETAAKIAFSAIITAVAFGVGKIKAYLRALFCFYAVSFIYAGFMLGFWHILKPKGMTVNNGVVYFSVSPLVLICSTALCYMLIRLLQSLLRRENSLSPEKNIRLNYGDNSVLCRCMVDSGNTVNDIYGDCGVVIIDRVTADYLFGETLTEQLLLNRAEGSLATRFRLIPYKTLNASGVMPCVKIDSAEADNKKTDKVIVGIVSAKFDGDFSGIVSPDFL